jgi:hypothetical protein
MLSWVIAIALIASLTYIGIRYIDPVWDRVKTHMRKVTIHYFSDEHWQVMGALAMLTGATIYTYQAREHTLFVVLGFLFIFSSAVKFLLTVERLRHRGDNQ